ncbi:MAG: radical SAM family heme chaperone HemW [Campylobacterales bacterium]
MMIYIHIPFCESKCPYCAFNSYVSSKNTHKNYMAALLRQLESDLQRFGVRSAQSLYIGGGTPSTVEAGLYEPLFERLSSVLEPNAEVTIEANPGSFTPGWAEKMRRFGVNRLSLGVQSFDDGKLGVLGRVHSGAQAVKALQTARSAGFAQISADLIYGVAGDTLEGLKGELSCAKAHGATHLSAYMLTLEEHTPFETRADLCAEDEALFRAFGEAIEAAGYPRYEVAAFGKNPGRHNLGYWTGMDYLGIGAGATGTVGRVRYEPLKDPAAYAADPLARSEETIDDAAWQMERVMLGLRCLSGFEAALLAPAQLDRARLLAREGRLRFEGGRFFGTDFLIADEAALFILG